MRFFHLSDLHIGKQLHQYSLIEDQRHVLTQVIDMVAQHKPDAIVIAGDIYDKPIPSAEAVGLFDWFITELAGLGQGCELMMISGNHDSGPRLNFASRLLERINVHIAASASMDCIRLKDEYGFVDFYLLPFIKPGYVRQLFDERDAPLSYDDAVRRMIDREDYDESVRRVIVSHQFFTASNTVTNTCDSELLQVGGLDQVDVSALYGFDYAALGHIHGAQYVGEERFCYCGTLLKYSVSEANHEKALVMVDLKEKGSDPIITRHKLAPLRDVRVIRGEFDEILRMGASDTRAEDYVSITLTDELEVVDARERILNIYPNLLELKVDNARTRQEFYGEFRAERMPGPEEIFAEFFEGIQGREPSEDERDIFMEAIRHITEVVG